MFQLGLLDVSSDEWKKILADKKAFEKTKRNVPQKVPKKTAPEKVTKKKALEKVTRHKTPEKVTNSAVHKKKA